MDKTLLDSRALTNDMILYLYDASRRQTADRWIVVMEAHLEIPVDERALASGPADLPDLVAVREIVGARVAYVSRRERVFVADGDKDRLLQTLREAFIRASLPYLSHPAFPGRFIAKQYREVLKQRALREAQASNSS